MRETGAEPEEVQVEDEVGRVSPAGTDDGTAAVLYGMFTSFTEVLGSLESQLAAIEDAVRAGPNTLAERLPALEAAVRAGPAHLDARLGAIEVAVRTVPVPEERLAALEAAVDALRALLQAHVDETTHSLGRRAGEAGRRLAGDLGLRGRPKPPSLG